MSLVAMLLTKAPHFPFFFRRTVLLEAAELGSSHSLTSPKSKTPTSGGGTHSRASKLGQSRANATPLPMPLPRGRIPPFCYAPEEPSNQELAFYSMRGSYVDTCCLCAESLRNHSPRDARSHDFLSLAIAKTFILAFKASCKA